MKKRKSYVIKNRVGVKKYIDWKLIKVENNLPMSGENITKEIYRQTGVKITRQGVSNALKSSMRKIYFSLKKSEHGSKPFDIALLMFNVFFPSHSSSEDADSFFSLFPDDIREEIKVSINER